MAPALTTRIKLAANRWLARANLRLDTLTAERLEEERLAGLEDGGHFARKVFPVPEAMRRMDASPVLEAALEYADRFDDLRETYRNPVGFCFDNGYYSSPDAEVLYCMLRRFQPGKIVEIGCGNSTRISRLAIDDGGLASRLIAIDPLPRADVSGMADEIHRVPAESAQALACLKELVAGDVLFIDSSHAIRPGNDVVTLYLNAIPRLPAGVLIHIHDVFLPYEYPSNWVVAQRWGWTEQYLVQAMLLFGDAFEVLWAGRYLQRTHPEFDRFFPHAAGRLAQSMWLRKTSPPVPDADAELGSGQGPA